MKASRILAAALLALALSLVVGCPPPPPGVVYASIAPPAAQVEFVGAAPGPDHVWVRGFWRWDGRSYAWVPGHFERAPRPRARWVDGRWRHDRNGWFWVEGHWR